MTRPPLKVVTPEAVRRPTSIEEALIAATAKAMAAGATVFVLAYQIEDEPITVVSYPPAKAFKAAFVVDASHAVNGNPEPVTDWIDPDEL